MSLEEEMANPTNEETIHILHQRLRTAKEEREFDLESFKITNDCHLQAEKLLNEKNINLTQQNKQMRECLDSIRITLNTASDLNAIRPSLILKLNEAQQALGVE